MYFLPFDLGSFVEWKIHIAVPWGLFLYVGLSGCFWLQVAFLIQFIISVDRKSGLEADTVAQGIVRSSLSSVLPPVVGRGTVVPQGQKRLPELSHHTSLSKAARGKRWRVKWALCLRHLVQESISPQLPFTSHWSALGRMPSFVSSLAGGDVIG